MLQIAVMGKAAIYAVVSGPTAMQVVVIVDGESTTYGDLWGYLTRSTGYSKITSGEFRSDFWEMRLSDQDYFTRFYRDFKPDAEASLLKGVTKDVPKNVYPNIPKVAVVPPSRSKRRATKGLAEALEVKAPIGPRRKLREEPYDPEAKDGDGDGIVQEGTAWERPAGTRILDAAGKEIARGQISGNRSRSHRIVDADNNEVEYTPTYERSEIGTIGRSVGMIRGADSEPEATVEPAVEATRPSKFPDYLNRPVAGIDRLGKDARFSDVTYVIRSILNEVAKRAGMERLVEALGLVLPVENLPDEWIRENLLYPGVIPDDWLGAYVDETELFMDEIVERGIHIAIPQFALFGEEVRADRGGSFRTPGILADERVKSQFETGTSQGYLNPSFRSDFEADHMGVPQDIEETQRPIYGFIPTQIDEGTGEVNLYRDPAALYSGGWPFGRGVILRLKPGVEDRTTASFGDSLDGRRYPIPLSKQLRESHAQQLQESIDVRLENIPEGLPLTGEQNLVIGAEGDPLHSVVGPRLADRFIEEALSGSDSLVDVWFPGRSERNPVNYIEAQIHGGVDLADVEELILPEGMSMYERQPNGAVLRTDIDIRDFLASDVPDAKLLMEKALKHGITITYRHPETKKIETWYAPPSKAQPTVTRQVGSFTGSTPDAVPDVGPVLTDTPIGVNADSGDRDELPEPVKPRAPYTPAPPPFSGKAADIVQMARLDFERVLELLDEEGYWLLDFETTGFDHGNMPTQVAMVRVEKGQVVQRINQFINPDRPLSDWSRQHLRDGDGQPLTEEWLAENGISVDEAQRRLSALLDGQIVVAHNAPFDLEVLQRIVDQNNGVLNLGGSVDTLALMRMAVPKGDGDETGPKSHALGSLAEYLGYTLGEDAHDALADVDATNEVLRRGLVAAATNPRAELGVLDNLYMKRLYSRQQEQYEVDLAKHRDAMREYNRQVFEYRRALSGGKNASVPDIRVPYTPGPASSQTILDKAQKQRLAVKSALRNQLIETLASLGDGGDGREEWVRLHQTLAVESESRSTGLSTSPEELGETARKMTQSERIEFLEKNFGPIFDRDQEFIDEVIDEALALHVDSELTKQVYVPATEIVAAQILRDGRVMTQFEQPVEGLEGSLRERASVETELLGVPRGTSDKNRPVYGYMPRTTDAEFGSTGTSDPDPTSDPSTIHGSIAIRLKDDIRDRTTATFGDSMTGSVGIAVPVTERAREELLRSYPDPEVGSRTDVRNSLLQAAVSDEFVEGVASVASGAWIDRLPDEMRRAVNARMRRSGMIASLTPQRPHYIEAQVHGGVSLDDIAELVLPNEVGSFSDAMRAVLTLARWRNIRIRTADGRVPLETDTGWRFVRPDENKSSHGVNSQSPYVEMKAASRRIALIDEPYNPDAKDGDGDGIVQEWTVWERPAGTVLLLDGKPVVRGQRIKSTSLTARPTGLTVVDKDGNVVDYKPSYQPRLEEGSIGAGVGRLTPTGGASTPQPEAAAPESQKPKKRGTPLSDVGGQSIQERGTASVRQTARPAAPPQTSAQPGVAPQPDPDARKLPVLPSRDRIEEFYTPGQGDVYNPQKSSSEDVEGRVEWELTQYLLVDYEELYDSYLSRMIEKILDDFDLSNPTEVEWFLEYIRPIAPNIDAIRELLKRSFDPLRERGVTSKYSFEDAALPILQQLFKENFESDISDALIEAHVDDLEVRTKGAPRVAILQNALIKALQDGRILSQFESGTSQGTYDPTYRRRLEQRAMGVPEMLNDQFRPIYGFFPDLNRLFGWTEDGEFVVSYGKRKNAELPPLENSSVAPYGNIQVVLKEGLRERTTVSVGDSFGVRKATAPLSDKALEEIGRKVGYERPDGTVDIDRVRRLTSVLSRKQYGNFSLMALALNGLFTRQNPEKRKFLLDALKKSGYMKVDEIEEVPFGFEYTEAQIHGGVDIQDIEKVILPYANAETAPSALIALLDLRGITYEFQFG